MDVVCMERSNSLLLSPKVPVLIKFLCSLHPSNINFFCLSSSYAECVQLLNCSSSSVITPDLMASMLLISTLNRINQKVRYLFLQQTLHLIRATLMGINAQLLLFQCITKTPGATFQQHFLTTKQELLCSLAVLPAQ